MPFYACMWLLRAPPPYAQVMFGSRLFLVERFCYISLGSDTKCLAATEEKNLAKRKLECHVESDLRFDMEVCSGM